MSPRSQPDAGLIRWIAAAAVLLGLATWPLWTAIPDRDQPRIPWLTLAIHWPSLIDPAACGLTFIGLTALALQPQRAAPGSRLLNLTVIAGAVLLLGDQHRLQPWAWQFWLLGAALASGLDLRRAAMWLTVSIYFFSGCSKLDRAFLDSLGTDMLGALLTSPFRQADAWGAAKPAWQAALVLPIAELAVAVMIALPKLRQIGWKLSFLMHGLLLYALGWKLQHSSGVVLWNVYFLGQNWLLSRRPTPPLLTASNVTLESPSRAQLLPRAAFLGVCLLPVLEWVEWYDHWPGWAVYSTRSALVRVWLTDEAMAALPTKLQEFVEPAPPLEPKRRLRLDRWSMTTRRCPISPQLRYQLALSRALLKTAPVDAVEVEIFDPPNRWTGFRERRVLRSLVEVERELQNFFANTRARP